MQTEKFCFVLESPHSVYHDMFPRKHIVYIKYKIGFEIIQQTTPPQGKQQ